MSQDTGPEFDFTLVIGGLSELTSAAADALFEAGCDDATFSVRYGRLYGEFSRPAATLKDAILSAVRQVNGAGIDAAVLHVDRCDLVTQADIARRMNRSRQMVHQYINGDRGPGTFPPPACQLAEGAPLWHWCEVSPWLAENDLIRQEEGYNAVVVATINNRLETARRERRHAGLVREVLAAIP